MAPPRRPNWTYPFVSRSLRPCAMRPSAGLQYKWPRPERLIEETKPEIPDERRHLDYLLATPFRYGPVYPHGSRFRRAGKTSGVFYAAEKVETAVAELAFYRLLFFPKERRTWRLKLRPAGIHALCEFPIIKLGFDRAAFSADPRVASFAWALSAGSWNKE